MIDNLIDGLMGAAGASGEPVYVEDVFATSVWAGTGSNQTLTTGIDTSTYGGLFWTKNRTNAFDHALWSTNFSITSGNYLLKSNSTSALTYGTYGTGDYVSDSTTGVTVYGNSSQNYVTWAFRKQEKFFDVVTFVKDSSTNQRISHNLGSVPGCIIVKRVTSTDDWYVYHRSLGGLNKWISLNSTNAVSTTAGAWGSSDPTDTDFGVSTNLLYDGGGTPLTYVAYVFAHDAGGFGLDGTENIISCGRLTSSGAPTTVNLGYEVQWLLVKELSSGYNWAVYNTMEGMSVTGAKFLLPNSSSVEQTDNTYFPYPTATGFGVTGSYSNDLIYIAIRRGPMKKPTSGTSVFSPQVQTPTGASDYVMAGSSGFPIDWLFTKRKSIVGDWYQTSRLTNNYMSPNTTAAEGAYTYGFDLMQGVSAQWNANSTVSYAIKRAPSFFDVVCYKGVNSGGQTLTVSHNLKVTPELVIIKQRDSVYDWLVYSSATGTSKILFLNLANAAIEYPFLTSPSASTITVGAVANNDTGLYVAYLFATCPGVSKVGSFSYETGSSTNVDCGFTNGARFVLLKQTDGADDWYVWDTARGINSGNDPFLKLNSTAAENSSYDGIDPYSAGFTIPAGGLGTGTFIFLAIA